jgi:hypothetical protein
VSDVEHDTVSQRNRTFVQAVWLHVREKRINANSRPLQVPEVGSGPKRVEV